MNQQAVAPVMNPPWQALLNKPGQYDAVVDKQCLTADEGLLAKLTRVSYKRPKETKGSEALGMVSKWIDHGLRLRGGKDDLGFLFFYEVRALTSLFFWFGMRQLSRDVMV